MPRYRIAALLSLSLLLAAAASAEDRSAVFIHGLASSSATWNGAVSRLTPQLALQSQQPDLNWRGLFEAQASELDQRFGNQLPPDVVAVGHSNGGVVARQWSRIRGVGGIVTLAAPNQGAPIVDHLFEWFAFLDDVLARIADVNVVFGTSVNRDTWWWLPAQWAARFAFAVDVWDVAGRGLAALGFDAPHVVLPEMRVGSAYMTNLNSASNRDREASAVAARVAIVNVARDFDVGGPFRIIAPDNYEAWHNAINIAGVSLEGLAGLIWVMADPSDQSAFELADRVGSVGEWFLQFEEVWCRTVSDPSPYPIARCFAHDGVVPAWSQAYDLPRLPYILRTDGPIHTRETGDSDAQLYQALTTVALVQPRSGSVPASTPISPPASSPPVPSPTAGRYKLNGTSCYWDPNDTGPNQCTPKLPPTGRFKVDGWGACYWEPKDYAPDQCSPTQAPSGRFKVDGAGACYWEAHDTGPNQCAP